MIFQQHISDIITKQNTTSHPRQVYLFSRRGPSPLSLMCFVGLLLVECDYYYASDVKNSHMHGNYDMTKYIPINFTSRTDISLIIYFSR